MRKVILHGDRNVLIPGHVQEYSKGFSVPGVLTQDTHFWVLLTQGVLQGTHFWVLADGTMKIIVISEGVIQGCNFGTLFALSKSPRHLN